METSNKFKQVIQEHLNFRAFTDPLFAQSLKKENKNIDDCVTYILNQVKESGQNGFDDEEIFAMAIHFYDEDDLKPGEKFNGRVVVNHKVELTSKEIAEAKQKAIDAVFNEQKAKMLTKPTKKKVVVTEKAKEDKNPNTLF